MRNIILRRIIIYIIAFIVCLVFSINSAKSSDNAYQNFYDNLNSIMQKHNYVNENKDTIAYDLKFLNGNNYVRYQLKKTKNETLVKDISSETHLYYNENILTTLNFLNEVYEKEDLKLYQNEIQNLINKYQTTNEDEMFQDLDENRQVTIGIESSNDKDFKLYYSVRVFN